MNGLFASNPDSLGRRAWDRLDLDRERPGRPDAAVPTARDSAFGRWAERKNQPKIVQLVDGRVNADAGALAKLLVRRFADQYQFSSICIGRLDDAPALDDWRSLGLSVQVVERKPGLDWRCSRRLAALLQRERADLVHAHGSTAFVYSLLARLHYRQPSILFTAHDRPHPDAPSPRRAAIHRMLVEGRDRVVAVNRSIRQSLLLNEGMHSDQVEVVYNGVAPPARPHPDQVHSIRRSLGIAGTDLVILQAAPFNLFQNQSLAVQALEQVVRELPDARLLFVGDGPEREPIQRLVTRSRLDGSVTFLESGYEDEALVHAADLVLSTSLGEPHSEPLFRALAAGRPVVATRVGGVSEIVEDRVCGLLVGSGDYGALAEMIVRLGRDSDLRERFGDHGRRRALALFSEQETSSCYASLYKTMLSPSR